MSWRIKWCNRIKGAEEANYAIRVLLTRRPVDFQTPPPDPNPHRVARPCRLPGDHHRRAHQRRNREPRAAGPNRCVRGPDAGHPRRPTPPHGDDRGHSGDDYELATPAFMQRCLGYALRTSAPKAHELCACVQRMMWQHHQTTVTRDDMCRWTGWRLAQVRKLLP